MVLLGEKEYFQGINEIKYEGRDSDNPLAFKFYNPEQVVAGKTMRDHFKFAMAYWHTLCGTGGDPFGPGTKDFPWSTASDPMVAARERRMPPLSSLPRWGLIISVFMTMTLWMRLPA